jgi:hypothetical protein
MTESGERAAGLTDLIAEVQGAGFAPDGELAVQIKRSRLELLEVKGAADRQFAGLALDCAECQRRVRWAHGLGAASGTGRIGSRLRTIGPSSRCTAHRHHGQTLSIGRAPSKPPRGRS